MPDDIPIPLPTREELEESRKICEAATEGPWGFESWDECADGYAHVSECDVLEPTGIKHVNDYEGYWNDWRLIMHARTALPLRNQQCLALLEKLAAIRKLLESAVCTEDPDKGVVMLSSDGPTTRDPITGYEVYDCDYFSPLGDALIAAWKLTRTDAEIDAAKGEG